MPGSREGNVEKKNYNSSKNAGNLSRAFIASFVP